MELIHTGIVHEAHAELRGTAGKATVTFFGVTMPHMETFSAPSIEVLHDVAATILADLKSVPTDRAVVLTLAGELGAGKTAFVQQLGELLGIRETITSPTFVVMKRYETTDEVFTNLIHIDAYRLEGEAETAPLHWGEVLATPQSLVCIEWAALITRALPATYATLTIIDTDGTRTLTYTPYGH